MQQSHAGPDEVVLMDARRSTPRMVFAPACSGCQLPTHRRQACQATPTCPQILQAGSGTMTALWDPWAGEAALQGTTSAGADYPAGHGEV